MRWYWSQKWYSDYDVKWWFEFCDWPRYGTYSHMAHIFIQLYDLIRRFTGTRNKQSKIHLRKHISASWYPVWFPIYHANFLRRSTLKAKNLLPIGEWAPFQTGCKTIQTRLSWKCIYLYSIMRGQRWSMQSILEVWSGPSLIGDVGYIMHRFCK